VRGIYSDVSVGFDGGEMGMVGLVFKDGFLGVVVRGVWGGCLGGLLDGRRGV